MSIKTGINAATAAAPNHAIIETTSLSHLYLSEGTAPQPPL